MSVTRRKIGILSTTHELTKAQRDLVLWARSSDRYTISNLIVVVAPNYSPKGLHNGSSPSGKQSTAEKSRAVVLRILTKLESRLTKRSGYPNFFDNFDPDLLKLKVTVITADTSNSQSLQVGNLEKLDEVKALELDLVIDIDSGANLGGPSQAVPWNILLLSYKDNRLNMGGPAGFWESAQGQKSTGFMLGLRQSGETEWNVLSRGNISTSFLFTINHARLCEKAQPFLYSAIDKILVGQATFLEATEAPFDSRPMSLPTVKTQARYIWSSLKRIFRNRRLYRTLRWNVAYQFTSSWQNISFWKSFTIKNPAGRYLADPFMVKENGKHYCFVEDFSVELRKGVIAVYEVSPHGYEDLGTALEEDFHLSYPFIFSHEGHLYMCPETAQIREIRLYVCKEFPTKWELSAVLMRDVDAADTSIFWHHDRWWMFSNICSADIGEHGSELHIFHSKELFSSSWTAHTNNPVVFDSRWARNAGLIFDQKKIFRVHQRQGFDAYGEAFGVSEITHLSEKKFSENNLFIVEPNFFPRSLGTHTLNYDGEVVVFDYADTVKLLSQSFANLNSKIKRLLPK